MYPALALHEKSDCEAIGSPAPVASCQRGTHRLQLSVEYTEGVMKGVGIGNILQAEEKLVGN